MTEWTKSAGDNLEYEAGTVGMKYRCTICGAHWSEPNGMGLQAKAMWALHAHPHEKTDEVLAQTIAIEMGVY